MIERNLRAIVLGAAVAIGVAFWVVVGTVIL